MIKSSRFYLLLIITNIFSVIAFGQHTIINGSVKNSVTGETVPAVSITVKGSGAGTYTNDKGNFTLEVNTPLPLTIVVSSIGFKLQEVVVTTASELVNVSLTPESALGQEVVVAATRTPSRILESPVTIERISAANIRNTASVSYYDMISKLKGVDVVTSSLTFSTPSTRGFNGSGSVRVNQIVDGMDNQAPGLNFSVGSVVGLTELDVESVELLQGASSALYGPGGMNGAIVINSKDPFKYQGLSFQVKTGIMNVGNSARSASPYYNWDLRWANKVSEKFAFKVGAQLVQAKDWVANDYRDYDRLATTGGVKTGTRETDPNYDGINVYGDETTVDIRSNVLNPIAQQVPFYAPYVKALPASIPVSRTGYLEKDIVNPNTVDFKLSGELSYKLTQNTSLNAEAYWGTGNTVYTGSDRYSLLNLKIGQYKVELLNANWFLRAYTTQENAGDSYNATVTTRLVNEAWKPSGGSNGWYVQYSLAFLNAKLSGLSDIAAHNAARAVADQGRPAPGSPEFKQLFDQVRSVPISKGGGLFVDKTNLYNIEGQYNLTPYTSDFADVLIGANFKRYVLNSEGTLFADSSGKIPINEYGAYLQATKHFFNDKLRVIASGRYDRNDNFKGRFTPRISFVIKVAEDNNIRLSYQEAYRFASTQMQYINLRVAGGEALIGGVPSFKKFYHFNTNPVYSIDANLFAGNPQVINVPDLKAENVNSFEVGYKGLLLQKKLLIDLYGYYGVYNNFLSRTLIAQSVHGNKSVFTGSPEQIKANLNNSDSATTFSVPYNVRGKVNTYGFGVSLTYALPHNFAISGTVSSDNLDKVPAGFAADFDAPKYRAGATFSSTGFGFQNRLGFSVTYRWQDKINFEGDFANGLLPAYQTVDGQISFKFPEQKVLLKLGATNLLNQYYRDGFGNATIGGIYYVSIGYNIF
ncbi:TonB-dependent receptor [Ginsengibacter hankyongi]|uniref:TonB-dependent receptor n=1 Tax=Ginsengibacter hankyongi TaxID=2607284 RepID=A0A5J5IC06_9BACT|nr:TonB-dependent receptor [Ginsengibacter hankyongi]KAA9036342.1 TonB-dependent receptor [Ginsengibacter hankyongi]